MADISQIILPGGETPQNIKALKIPYGTCSTAAATAAKTVTIRSDNGSTGNNAPFVLEGGAIIAIKFTVTNTAANPTLNVNETGAKAIYYRGSAIAKGNLAANRTYQFVYNGTQWEFVGDINTDTNTDTKVTATKTNPTTQTSYYPTWYSSAAGGTGGVGINDGIVYNTKEGTTSADGIGQIFLGNGVASGTAGNKKGYLRIYNNSTGYALLSYVDDSTAQKQQTFPATAGTVLNTGTTLFTQTLTSGTEIGKLKINNVETTLYAQDNTKLPLAGGTMSGDIKMNGNTIQFGSGTDGVFAQYSDNVLNIGNQSGRMHFSNTGITFLTPGGGDLVFEPGTNSNCQIKSDLKVSGNVYANKIFGYSSGSPSVEIRSTSGAPPYIKVDTSSITISAASWATGTGTAAYITGTSGANKIVKYSSSRRYKDNIDYEINKEKYHEDLLKLKPCRFNYKTEPDITNLGLIAEDVEEINPELCNFEGNKVESFKDRDLLVMCILELQRKDKEINELKSRLESLETRYNVEF